MLRFIFIFIFLNSGIHLFAQPGTTTESTIQLQEIFIEGNKEKLLGNWEKAAAKFEELLSKDTKNHAAAYELARVYMAVNSLDKAVDMARNAVSWDPANIWYKIQLAELYQKTNKDNEAAAIYEQLSQQNPRNPEYYLKRAYHLVRAGSPESAIKVYNEMEKITGVQEESSRLKHNLYVGIGNYKKAAQELESLIHAKPGNTGFRHMLATFYEQINEKAKAKEIYQQILKINPEDARAKIALAGDAKNEDIQLFLKSLQPVFRNQNVGIDLKIKEILPFVKRLADGETEFGPVLLELAEIMLNIHNAEAKVHALSGDLFYHTGQIDKALPAYLKTLELDPSVWPVWEQVLRIYDEKRDFVRVVEYSEKALDYFPNQAFAYLLNGRAYNALEKPQKGMSSLQQALLMADSNPQTKYEVLAERGVNFFLLKDYSRSDDAFEEALKINPNGILALKHYIYCLASRPESLQKAKLLAEQLSSITKYQYDTEAIMGFVLYKMKDFENAKNWLDKALQHSGDKDPFVLETYGNVLYQLGQHDQALQFWQSALNSGGKSTNLERKISEGKLLE